MYLILLEISERLSRAIATFPDLGNPNLVAAIGVYALFMLVLGLTTGFLHWDLCRSKKTIVRVMATSFITPAILEELFFRVILLPYPSSKIAPKLYFIESVFSLCLFVIYHPLNAITFFPQGRKTFFNPIFLILATALGIVCTLSYWQTGSLWLPVSIHWLSVVLWLLCFGGLNQLDYQS